MPSAPVLSAPPTSAEDDRSTCCPSRKRPDKQSRWLIVGGGGYVGWNIASEIGSVQNEPVCMLDIGLNRPTIFPGNDLPKNTVFLKADVRNRQAMFDAFKTFQPDVVLHICSYGMSGTEQLNKQLTEEINIDGLKNSLDACVEFNVERFVYISSDTVVLGRDRLDLINGDENTPRVPLHKHCSHYALTKSVAEEIVLASSGILLRNDSSRLHACILRIGGIYGVGEMRHIPRFVAYLERGFICFVPGVAPATQDFINVRNLVQALILAGDALHSERASIADGKIYCVSDGKPIGCMEFFEPLITGLGYSVPKIRVPAAIMFFLADVVEGLIGILPKSLGVKPFLTRQETLKSCTVHYFNIDRARRELNYRPREPPNDMQAVAQDYLERGYKRPTGRSLMSVVGICMQVLFVLLLGWLAVSFVF